MIPNYDNTEITENISENMSTGIHDEFIPCAFKFLLVLSRNTRKDLCFGMG